MLKMMTPMTYYRLNLWPITFTDNQIPTPKTSFTPQVAAAWITVDSSADLRTLPATTEILLPDPVVLIQSADFSV